MGSPGMSRRKPNTTVRLEPELLVRLEKVRDPERYPTQSDFIREAIRRMVREERRNRVREEMKALTPEQLEYEREMANLGIEEWFEKLDTIDRGE